MYTCIGPSQLHASFYWIYASAGHMLLPDAHFHWTQTSLGRILSTCFVPSSRTSKARDTHRMEQVCTVLCALHQLLVRVLTLASIHIISHPLHGRSRFCVDYPQFVRELHLEIPCICEPRKSDFPIILIFSTCLLLHNHANLSQTRS